MKNINQMTDDEIRELLFEPLSKEDTERLREADVAAKWLLGLNLRDLEREENENDEE